MIPITKPYFDKEEMKQLQDCLNSGWVTQGPKTEQFEKGFREKQSCEYAVAVSSCTAALHIAMLALDIKAGDEVIVPAFTWITSASCVEYVGADVRFVDVETETMNINPKLLEEAITERTKAIVVVHLFGCSAKMDEIMDIAQRYNLKVIEDCACAIGTTYKGKKVGTIGDIGCFSFHPRKAITTGEGGICSTDNKNLYNRLLQFRNHGANPRRRGEEYGMPYYMGIYDELGYNLRMSDIQAAVGVAQLDKLEMLLDDRKRCAKYYVSKLIENDGIMLPNTSKDFGNTYQSFVIMIKSGNRELRNQIMIEFKEKDIQSRPGTICITRTEYNNAKYGNLIGKYPVAEFCEDSSITLPIYPFMKNEEMDMICNVLELCLLK